MDPRKLPQPLTIPAELALAFFEGAAVSARAAARLAARASVPRRRIGLTLRPSPATPLWNELIRQTLLQLHKRGEKVKLARFLGLPRQRVHEFLKSRRACPDAERTLLLLCWVARRQQGFDL